jgi:hypothetical protein
MDDSDMDTISEPSSYAEGGVQEEGEESLEEGEQSLEEGEESGAPTDDISAADLFFKLEGKNWITLKPDYKLIFYDEDTHLWIITGSDKSIKSIAYKLLKRHIDVMGKYARFNCHANKVIERMGSYNVVEEDWAIDLDHMPDGLIPFDSCIIDIRTGARIEYADTTYKLSEKVPYDYDPNASVCPEATQFLKKRIIERLYPEEALRLEVMKLFAVIMFTTRNADKMIMELYGNGNNGKTTLIECLAEVFPGFVYSASAQDLTYSPENNADKAEPWKIRAMGCRLLHVDEPKHGKPLDGSLLKLIRGGGKVSGRDLNKPQITYRPTYHPVITPNDLVDFKPAEGAIMASVAPHVFEMPSVFTSGDVMAEREQRNTPHIYPINMNLVERFRTEEYRNALIRELVEYYALYKEDGLASLNSEYCLGTTYTEEHETLDVIFDRHVELTGDMDDAVKISEIHDRIVHDDKWEGSKKKLRIYANNRFKRDRTVKFVTPAGRPTLKGARMRVIESVMAAHGFEQFN